MTIVAEYNYYLKYVDIGVGAWGDASEIERSKNANYERRYNKWNVGTKHTSRPAILMELRHLQSRMRQYATDFYGYEGLGKIIPMIDDMVIDLWGGVFNLNGNK